MATRSSRRRVLRGMAAGALGALGARTAHARAVCPNVPCAGPRARPCPAPCQCVVFGNGNSRCLTPGATTCAVAGLEFCGGQCLAPCPVGYRRDQGTCGCTLVCNSGEIPCGGACIPACVALDHCHDPGVCDPATRTCTNPAKPNGTRCGNDNACDGTETCQAGVCTPGTAVVCPDPDDCHEPGVCDPTTGACTYQPKADNSPCNDHDPCERNGVCTAGVCRGTPLDCSSSDGPCAFGRCNPQIGGCEVVPRDDGTSCDDFDLCTEAGVCDGGTCVPGPRRECAPSGPCVEASCNSATGECEEDPLPEGVTCGPCQVCRSGSCQPLTPAEICAAQGKTCGTIADGCGGTVNCGTCGAGFVCCEGQCRAGFCCGDAECGTGRHCCSIGCLDCCEDSHCPPDHFCDFGTCVPLCGPSNPCPSGTLCCPPGSVTQPGTCAACCSNADCNGLGECCGGICQGRCE